MQFVRGEAESFGNVLDGERSVRSRDFEIGHGFGEMEGEASAEYTTASLRSRIKKTRYVRRLARNQACWQNDLVENVFRRIKRLAVHLDHVMKMRTRGEAAASY